jgi:hypothetical protein
MCACTETDVRESANDCILASREGHGSRGETLHPICAARPVSSSSERSVFVTYISEMFSDGTVSGPANVTSLFEFSPNIVKPFEDKRNHSHIRTFNYIERIIATSDSQVI